MDESRIRRCGQVDFETIWRVINDGAQVYRGHVPEDCLHEPYMSRAELHAEIDSGVDFWGYDPGGRLNGVMGLQHLGEIALIRHAYVTRDCQRVGIGSRLLTHLRSRTSTPILIGTWAAATWAIAFYERHGFRVVGSGTKERLLRKYWNIPERQIETSVVLADEAWRTTRGS